MGQVQNEEHLCLIAVIGVERPNKATVEREFGERRSGDSGAWSVYGRQPERIQRVNAETTERVDVPRTRRVRTCLSLSVYNKLPESFHEPTLSASFLLTNFVTLVPKPRKGSRNAAAIMSSPTGSPFADVIQSVPELDGPGGSGRGDSNSPAPAHPHAGTEDGAAWRPGSIPRSLREDRKGMWVGPDGLASAPHPPANRGGAVGGAAAASSEPPGLRRPEASHPPAASAGAPSSTASASDRWSWGRTAGPSRWLTSSGTPAADGCWPGKAASSRSSTVWCWNSSLRGFPRRPRSGSTATARRRWTWPSNSPRTRWWRAMGLAKPYRPSLSLSPPLLFLPLPSCLGPVPAWFPESSPDGGEVRPWSRRP